MYPEGEAGKSFRKELRKIAVEQAGREKELEMEFLRMTKGGRHFGLVKDEGFLRRIRKRMQDHFNVLEGTWGWQRGNRFG